MNIDNVIPRNENMTRIYMEAYFEIMKRVGNQFEQILHESLLTAQKMGDMSHYNCPGSKERKATLRQNMCCYQPPSVKIFP